MKSALELALERANETVGGEENIKLSNEQKVAIDQIRKLYEAKWAEKELEINGVGYRAAIQGGLLKLSLGYSELNYKDIITLKEKKSLQSVTLKLKKCANSRSNRAFDIYHCIGG